VQVMGIFTVLGYWAGVKGDNTWISVLAKEAIIPLVASLEDNSF